jgi:hypothetical protein
VNSPTGLFRRLRNLAWPRAGESAHSASALEPLTVEAFKAGLLSDDLATRLHTAIRSEEIGASALTVATDLLSDQSLPSQTRVWALQAAARFLPSHPEAVNAAAIQALSDPAAEVRAVALQILDQSRPSTAIAAIAALQSDTAPNPLWWSDEGGTIGTTASDLLRSIGTTAALSLLKHPRRDA